MNLGRRVCDWEDSWAGDRVPGEVGGGIQAWRVRMGWGVLPVLGLGPGFSDSPLFMPLL